MPNSKHTFIGQYVSLLSKYVSLLNKYVSLLSKCVSLLSKYVSLLRKCVSPLSKCEVQFVFQRTQVQAIKVKKATNQREFCKF